MTYNLYTLDNQFIEKKNDVPYKFTGIFEIPDRFKRWLLYGKYHRLDGPAIEWTNGTKYWFIDDKQVTEEQHKLLVDIMKLKGLL